MIKQLLTAICYWCLYSWVYCWRHFVNMFIYIYIYNFRLCKEEKTITLFIDTTVWASFLRCWLHVCMCRFRTPMRPCSLGLPPELQQRTQTQSDVNQTSVPLAFMTRRPTRPSIPLGIFQQMLWAIFRNGTMFVLPYTIHTKIKNLKLFHCWFSTTLFFKFAQR